jgi:hypothetical protein
MVVLLNDEEMALCLEIAGGRNRKEGRFGAMTYGGVRGSLEAHLLGVVPEYAVARLVGGRVDREVFDGRGDDGRDLVTPLGLVVAVKSTTYKADPWLRVEVRHLKPDVDRWVCCAYDGGHEVVLAGWAGRDVVLAAPLKRLRPGGPLNRVVRPALLRPMDEWWCEDVPRGEPEVDQRVVRGHVRAGQHERQGGRSG